MRKFTKEHNDIGWLFPYPSSNSLDDANAWFDFYELTAKELADYAYNGQETYTLDDVIDAFMKGASVAHQRLNDCYSTIVVMNNYLNQENKELLKKIYEK